MTVSTAELDRLYALLPSLYREQDASEGYPLRALVRLVSQQADLVERDIQQLWNDLFIETSRPWVIPYIGDLVGNIPLYDTSRVPTQDTAAQRFTDLDGWRDLRPPVPLRLRADVAKTIYYRRRKGTLPMLEELARDVTGWPAHVVAFFELLGWTQPLEHIRAQAQWTDVRSVERMARVDGAFDETTHSVDVRLPATAVREGWHNVPTIGFFLWRLASYPIDCAPARLAPGVNWRYHFSPLGNDAPLFSRWRREGDEAGLATELHVAGPIRRAFFAQDLDRYAASFPRGLESTELYGTAAECSLLVYRNGVPVLPSANPAALPPVFVAQVVCRRLDPWPAAPPSGAVIAIDVESGRLAVGDGWPDATNRVDVVYHYGFSADMGGGPYERGKWLIRADLLPRRFFVKEDGISPPGGPAVTHSGLTALEDALADWMTAGAGRENTVITILDNGAYRLPVDVLLRFDGWLAIEAANGVRPVLRTRPAGLEVRVSAPTSPTQLVSEAALTLSGVLVEGFVHVTGDLGRLRLVHSTLVPGHGLGEDNTPFSPDPSISVEAASASGDTINANLHLDVAFSICGPLRVPRHASGTWLLDSILDGLAGAAYADAAGAAGPDLVVERSTIFGAASARTVHAGESIFTGPLVAERTQAGCVRFCYLAPGSHAPRRYRCQPDLAANAVVAEALKRDPTLSAAQRQHLREQVESWLVPAFTARRYGRPEYAQLHLHAPCEIRGGAEDGSEMGAFCHLKQPQRESNLRVRLEEYLPFGLQPGVIYVT